MSTITHERQSRPSLFGPIVLIAFGLFFLFNRLNPVTDLHWADVLRLWPLFLIFLGLNIFVQQAPRPYATLLSGLVALVAVVVFGYVLVAGVQGSLFGGFGAEDWDIQTISYPAAGLTSAEMDIEIGPPGADIFALDDSRELIAGTVTYNGDLNYHNRTSGDTATVTIAPRNYDGWIWEPEQWDFLEDEARWSLGFNPNVPLSLNLKAIAGSSLLDLRDLLVKELSLNVAAGEMNLLLPGGTYDVDMETNAAATTMTLPQVGQQQIDLRVNAGSVTIELPEGMELRVEVDQALGSFESQNRRFQRVGDSNIWQTAGYGSSPDSVNIILHIAVGSVTVR